MSECAEIPFWFVLLASYGAVSIVVFPGVWALHHLAEMFIAKDEPVTHIGQIKRPLFLRRG